MSACCARSEFLPACSFSKEAIRLVYAPKGESSGHITFKIADMAQVAGRPILAALHMLLSSERLFSLATEQRLPALLAASRKHQNLVSTKLSRQVMEALFDLLRGFQAAHDQNGILEEVLRTDPNQVYAGLLTVLLRLVFVLYAEAFLGTCPWQEDLAIVEAVCKQAAVPLEIVSLQKEYWDEVVADTDCSSEGRKNTQS